MWQKARLSGVGVVALIFITFPRERIHLRWVTSSPIPTASAAPGVNGIGTLGSLTSAIGLVNPIRRSAYRSRLCCEHNVYRISQPLPETPYPLTQEVAFLLPS